MKLMSLNTVTLKAEEVLNELLQIDASGIAFEIPGVWLDKHYDLCLKVSHEKSIVGVVHPFEPSLVENVDLLNESQREQALDLGVRTIKQIRNLGADYCVMRGGIKRGEFGFEDNESPMMTFYQQFLERSNGFGTKLYLPISQRAYRNASSDMRESLYLCNQLMHPRMALRMTHFPLEEGLHLEDMMKALFFNLDQFRLTWDEVVGTELTKEKVKKIQEDLAENAFHGRLVYAPVLHKLDCLADRIEQIISFS